MCWIKRSALVLSSYIGRKNKMIYAIKNIRNKVDPTRVFRWCVCTSMYMCVMMMMVSVVLMLPFNILLYYPRTYTHIHIYPKCVCIYIILLIRWLGKRGMAACFADRNEMLRIICVLVGLGVIYSHQWDQLEKRSSCSCVYEGEASLLRIDGSWSRWRYCIQTKIFVIA